MSHRSTAVMALFVAAKGIIMGSIATVFTDQLWQALIVASASALLTSIGLLLNTAIQTRYQQQALQNQEKIVNNQEHVAEQLTDITRKIGTAQRRTDVGAAVNPLPKGSN